MCTIEEIDDQHGQKRLRAWGWVATCSKKEEGREAAGTHVPAAWV
jgi:hypothetical protein